MMKKPFWKTYWFWLLVTEGTGALAGVLTREGTKAYQSAIRQPPLSPPPAVFPIVWTLLFALMGIGAARVLRSGRARPGSPPMLLFYAQLAFNFFWSFLFFNWQLFGLALLWLCALWVLILEMVLAFRRVDRTAAYLQVPYLLWVAFAGYLNLGVWLLNR